MTEPIGSDLVIPFLVGEAHELPVGGGAAAPEPEHFAAPFTVTRTGARTVQQGSPEDLAMCVLRVCQCPEGFREDSPYFGIPELAFQTLPLDLRLLEEAIKRWEPRATTDILEAAAGARAS